MPELPEVETVVNSLKLMVANQVFLGCDIRWHKTFVSAENNFLKKKITNVSRRGKYIIIECEDNYLVVHLRMTGKLFVINKQDLLLPEHQKHLRVSFELSDKYLLFQDQRKFGRVYFCKDLNWLEEKLGPEPLLDNFTVEDLVGICKSARQVKVLLLDQSKIAGLGNIYVDEVLWYAGVHPQTKAIEIPLKKIKLMHRGIKDILQKAIENKGTSFQSYTFEGSKKGGFVSELKVFNRAKAQCFKCSTIITKTRVGQRGTYVCTVCQVI